MTDRDDAGAVRKAFGDFRWDGVEPMAYKAPGTAPFRDVTRQVLFSDESLACEWRYFEVAAGGWTTLERHHHGHAVMVLRGHGQVLVGDRIIALAERDLVRIGPLTWHQFRADAAAPLGFLCLVDKERDRPQLPDRAALEALRTDPDVAAFIRV
jgi:quercetin dioxygenase-like cupin family protein